MTFDLDRERVIMEIELEFAHLRQHTQCPSTFLRWATKAAEKLRHQLERESLSSPAPETPPFKMFFLCAAIALGLTLPAAPPAVAQEAVIDVAAIAKAVEAIAIGQNQLSAVRYQSQVIGLTGAVPVDIASTAPRVADLSAAQVILGGQSQPASLSLPAAQVAVTQFLQPSGPTSSAIEAASGSRQNELIAAASDALARSIRAEAVATGDPGLLSSSVTAASSAPDLRTQVAALTAIVGHQAATLDEVKTLLAALLRVQSDQALAAGRITPPISLNPITTQQ
jgi:hypothetical protein